MPDSPAAQINPPAPSGRLRVSGRSIVACVAAIGLSLAALRVLASSQRVIGWILIAGSVAAVLYPGVTWLSRRLPRGIAVAVVTLAFLAAAAGATYGLVDGIVRETRSLEREAPRLAAKLEREGRFSEAARESNLSERTARFVAAVPERLRGGTPAQALRSAATRGLASLAVTVLTVFFLLHGPNLAESGGRQIHDNKRRTQAARVAAAVYRRAFGYARGTLLMAALAGAVTYGLARTASVPGPAPLAIWVALWDAVPLLGAVIGALPVVLFAAAIDPAKGVLLAVAFVTYQAVEYLVLQRRLERSTIKVGPFLTAAAGFAGLELYGLSGALLAILAVAIGAVVLDELSAP